LSEQNNNIRTKPTIQTCSAVFKPALAVHFPTWQNSNMYKTSLPYTLCSKKVDHQTHGGNTIKS